MDPRDAGAKLHFGQVYDAQMQHPQPPTLSPSSSHSSLDMIPYYLPQDEVRSNFPAIIAILCTLFLGLSCVVMGIMQRNNDSWGAVGGVLAAVGSCFVVMGCCCVWQVCRKPQSEEIELVESSAARQNTF